MDLSAREVEAELYSLFYRMPAQRAALRLAQSMVRGPRTKGDYMELFADMTIIADRIGWCAGKMSRIAARVERFWRS